MTATRAVTALLALTLLPTAACSTRNAVSSSAPTATIVVNAPFAALPSVAEPIRKGALLAAEELNRAGGVQVGDRRVRLVLRTRDNRLSPTAAAANVRAAVDSGAVAVLDEGTGIDSSYQAAAAVGLPIGIVYQGGQALVDPATRHNVFRIAPTDRGAAFRLAEYLVPKGMRVALLHDDGAYGAAGDAALSRAFSHNPEAVAATLQIPEGGDPAPQVLEARSRGATALVVWARPGSLAQVVRAVRGSGWDVPLYAGTSGSDPLVRQQLADHPEWLDGLTFVSSRLTAEKGPEPFEAYRRAYEKRFGPDRVGVRSAGRQVAQPPDWPMYAYDFVHVLAAAMTQAGVAHASPRLITALEDVDVPGANGDDRGFNQKSHEGVVDDDIFFASFREMVWTPVKDDALSATLPSIPQTD